MRILYSILLTIIAYISNYPQVEFTSSNLPIIKINTHGQVIVDEPKISATMGIIFNGEGIINYVSDSCNNFYGNIGIEIRGQSSQMFDKKQYGIETRDSNGENLDVALLGMPAENDWVLYAPYSDKSLMRNVIAYKLSNDLGRYASRTRFCELVLNGEYRGVYVFMEKIKRGKSRVNIKKLEPKDTTGDALTGGYIFKIDKGDIGDQWGWYSSYKPYPDLYQRIYYLYDYPKPEDITSQQKNYIKNFVSEFENVMNSPKFNDPFTGFYDWIDMDSFIDAYLLFEFCKNIDSYRLSTFFSKDKNSVNGKLKYGPIWDFDLAFGNCNYDDASLTTGWEVNYKNNSEFLTPFWNRKLFSDKVFINALEKKWNEVKNNILNYDSISAFIDSVSNKIEDARIRNFTKWNVLGQWIWPNNFVGSTYEEEINYLKNWISNRIEWLNTTLPDHYSEMEWLKTDSDTARLLTPLNNKFALSDFYVNSVNVDSVTFISNNDSVKFTLLQDSLKIESTASSEFLIKGVAWQDNAAVLISPSFSFKSVLTGIETDKNEFEFKLFQNYPNPFNPSTRINYQIRNDNSLVELKVYNILGKIVKTLVNEVQDQGNHEVRFNASNLSSGIYFYTLKVTSNKQQSNNYFETKKMVLIK